MPGRDSAGKMPSFTDHIMPFASSFYYHYNTAEIYCLSEIYHLSHAANKPRLKIRGLR